MDINVEQLLAGNRRALARSITLVESRLDKHRQQSQSLLEQVLPHSGKSVRIGITGIPGVGKSTFIETFGLHLIKQGHKVAVLAVDPSSPLRGGSILGDKTRMEQLSRCPEAYIRPSPAAGELGGVANKTRESVLLCEAAGYDIILVETVGVGQSEYEVAAMVDFFMVLMLPNAGDELQGIKKGIMELADALVINKADGTSEDLAALAAGHYRSALHLMRQNSGWQPKVMTCSALHQKGIGEVWQLVQSFVELGQQENSINSKRALQNQEWMQHLIREMLDLRLRQNQQVQQQWPILQDKVVKGETTPYAAAKQLMGFVS